MQLKVTDNSLSDTKDRLYSELKGSLYTFITDTSNFPEWKQANYADTSADLRIRQLSETLTSEELTELANITLVRSWKGDLIKQLAATKTSLYSSETNVLALEIFRAFNLTTAPFAL